MASTAVASIEKVAGWAKVSTVEDGPLDGAVTDQDLRDVCGFMVQWQSLAERLGVGEADLEEAKEDGPDARRKRELMLKKWKAALVSTPRTGDSERRFVGWGEPTSASKSSSLLEQRRLEKGAR